MRRFQQSLFQGLRYARRPWLALPLYLTSLLFGLLQAWSAIWANDAGPLLAPLALGETAAFVRLLLGGTGQAIGLGSLVWLLCTLLAVICYASTYNLVSGGALSVMAGRRSFMVGCTHFFWSFTGLGVLLTLFGLLALVAAALVGTFAGLGAGVAVALILLQLISLLGEYGRAIAVFTDQRRPLAMLGGAAGFIRQNLPGVLALAALGLLFHWGVAALFAAVDERAGYGAPLAQQAAALVWVWVKQLRLGWASAYVQMSTPRSTDVFIESPAGLRPL